MSTTTPQPDAASAPPDGRPEAAPQRVALGQRRVGACGRGPADLGAQRSGRTSTRTQAELDGSQQAADERREGTRDHPAGTRDERSRSSTARRGARRRDAAAAEPTPAEPRRARAGRRRWWRRAPWSPGWRGNSARPGRTSPPPSRNSRTRRSRPIRPRRTRRRPRSRPTTRATTRRRPNAQADQANAERDAAQAKAKIAAQCGKAYISAFAGLFGSGNVREQVPDVRDDSPGHHGRLQDGVRRDIEG